MSSDIWFVSESIVFDKYLKSNFRLLNAYNVFVQKGYIFSITLNPLPALLTENFRVAD